MSLESILRRDQLQLGLIPIYDKAAHSVAYVSLNHDVVKSKYPLRMEIPLYEEPVDSGPIILSLLRMAATETSPIQYEGNIFPFHHRFAGLNLQMHAIIKHPDLAVNAHPGTILVINSELMERDRFYCVPEASFLGIMAVIPVIGGEQRGFGIYDSACVVLGLIDASSHHVAS